MSKLVSLFCGIIFGIGLVISQMINPAKVLGFLNLFGEWDPSLAFVMIGALIVSSPLFHLFKNKEKPISSPPVNADIGVKLIIFIKLLKQEIQGSFTQIIFDILV